MSGKMSIGVATDSACDLPQELVNSCDIKVICNKIRIGQKDFWDSRCIDDGNEEAIDFLKRRNVYPTIVSNSEERYEKFFEEMLTCYDKVVYVTSSICNPASFENVCRVGERHIDVCVVDTKNLSAGVGHVAEKAAALAKIGFPEDKVKLELEKLTSKLYSSFISHDTYVADADDSAHHINKGDDFYISFLVEDDTKPNKRYVGNWNDVTYNYICDFMKVREKLSPKQLFVSHMACDKDFMEMVVHEIKEYDYFKKITLVESSISSAYVSGMESFGFYGVRK